MCIFNGTTSSHSSCFMDGWVFTLLNLWAEKSKAKSTVLVCSVTRGEAENQQPSCNALNALWTTLVNELLVAKTAACQPLQFLSPHNPPPPPRHFFLFCLVGFLFVLFCFFLVSHFVLEFEILCQQTQQVHNKMLWVWQHMWVHNQPKQRTNSDFLYSYTFHCFLLTDAHLRLWHKEVWSIYWLLFLSFTSIKEIFCTDVTPKISLLFLKKKLKISPKYLVLWGL